MSHETSRLKLSALVGVYRIIVKISIGFGEVHRLNVGKLLGMEKTGRYPQRDQVIVMGVG